MAPLAPPPYASVRVETSGFEASASKRTPKTRKGLKCENL